MRPHRNRRLFSNYYLDELLPREREFIDVDEVELQNAIKQINPSSENIFWTKYSRYLTGRLMSSRLPPTVNGQNTRITPSSEVVKI